MAIRWAGIVRTEVYDRYLRDFGCRNTTFIVPRDTSTLIRLVDLAVAPGDLVLDLGCGDGLAGVHAAVVGAADVIGVDVNAEAVSVARDNARCLTRPRGRLHAEHLDMTAVLTDAAVRQDLLDRCGLGGRGIDVVISNPPYIPMSGAQGWQPHEADALRRLPVTDLGVLGRSDALIERVAALRAAMIAAEDGGPDGLRFVREIIDHAPRVAGRVAWLQSSVTSPMTVLALLEQRQLRIDRLIAYATPFGAHAMAPHAPQQAHLRRMRDDGQAFYWSAPAGGRHWMLLLGFCIGAGDPASGGAWPVVRGTLHGLLRRFSERGPDGLPSLPEDASPACPFDIEVACYDA